MALQEQLPNKAYQHFLISILLVGTFLGCINKTTKPEIEKKIKSVPNITIVGTDSSFNFQKDTLFYLGKKFAGHIYALYPNGDSLFSGSYLNGKEEGIFKKWYPNGQLIETRIYIDGNKEGFHQGWWEDGTKKFEYHLPVLEIDSSGFRKGSHPKNSLAKYESSSSQLASLKTLELIS
jgi:hypothetical protein